MSNTFTTNLNLAVPSPGDLNWDDEYSSFNEAVDDLGNLLCFTVTVLDPAVNGTIFFDGFVPQENIMVKAIGLFAQTSPTGQSIKVDILKNGSAQNDPGILSDGSQFEKTVLVSSIGFLVTDRLGLKFTQVGSVVAGDKIVVTVFYQKEAIVSL